MVRHELSAFQRQAARSSDRGSISAFPVSRKNYTSTTGFRGARFDGRHGVALISLSRLPDLMLRCCDTRARARAHTHTHTHTLYSQIPMPATVSDEEEEAGDSMPEWGGRTVLPKIPSAIS